MTQCIWDYLKEEKVASFELRRVVRIPLSHIMRTLRRLETHPAVWSLFPSVKEAPEGLEAVGGLHSGSPSQNYNHSWKVLILWDGNSLSICSASHLAAVC